MVVSGLYCTESILTNVWHLQSYQTLSNRNRDGFRGRGGRLILFYPDLYYLGGPEKDLQFSLLFDHF
jgi:hypothetical protein